MTDVFFFIEKTWQNPVCERYAYFGTHSDENTEGCISALLETSVVHAPHFDWVVAHLGSCFPATLINRVLALGLKVRKKVYIFEKYNIHITYILFVFYVQFFLLGIII